ncbi:MAG: hypothetical protein ABIK12_00420 [Pseudomonadota bacterium]
MTAALIVSVNGLAPYVHIESVRNYLWALFLYVEVHGEIRAAALKAVVPSFPEHLQKEVLTKLMSDSLNPFVKQAATELLAQLGPKKRRTRKIATPPRSDLH